MLVRHYLEQGASRSARAPARHQPGHDPPLDPGRRARAGPGHDAGLEDTFRYVSSVPQELMFHQMKAVITRDLRFQGGALVRNLVCLRFSHHSPFTPPVGPNVRRPQQSRAPRLSPPRWFCLLSDVHQRRGP
jgi:hypothetical protein